MIRPIDLDYVGEQNLPKKDKIDMRTVAKHSLAIASIFIAGWLFSFLEVK